MKAVFVDRDGVINELVYHQEQGIIDSPFTVEQFRLLLGAGFVKVILYLIPNHLALSPEVNFVSRR